jgi:uroporphyrinogen-III decarboxylase
VADDLFDNARVDGYYEVDRRAGMDLARLRERYPGPVLMGNMSSATLHTGTRQEVIAETRSCLEVARRMGGVIVGVSNYVMPGTPSANLEALIETLERER